MVDNQLEFTINTQEEKQMNFFLPKHMNKITPKLQTSILFV